MILQQHLLNIVTNHRALEFTETQNMRNLDVVTRTYTVATLKTKKLTPKSRREINTLVSILYMELYYTIRKKEISGLVSTLY